MNSKDDFWGFMDTYVDIAYLCNQLNNVDKPVLFLGSTFMDAFYPETAPSFWLLGTNVTRGGGCSLICISRAHTLILAMLQAGS